MNHSSLIKTPHPLPPDMLNRLEQYLESMCIEIQSPLPDFPVWTTFEAVVTWAGAVKSGTMKICLDDTDITSQFTVSSGDSSAHATLTTSVGDHSLTATAELGVLILVQDQQGYRYQERTQRVKFKVLDFELRLNPTSVTIEQGDTSDVKIDVQVIRLGGFTGDITVDPESLPPFVSSRYRLLLPYPETTGTLFLWAQSTAPACRIKTKIEGTAYLQTKPQGSESRSRQKHSEELDVRIVPPPDFSVSLDTDTVELVQGGSNSVQVSILRTGEFIGDVQVHALNLPQGVSYETISIKYPAVTGAIKLSASSVATLGDTGIMIYAVATIKEGTKKIEHGANLNHLRIIGPMGIQAQIHPTSLSLNAYTGSSDTVTVSITRLNSFSGSIDVKAENLPEATCNEITISYPETAGILTFTAIPRRLTSRARVNIICTPQIGVAQSIPLDLECLNPVPMKGVEWVQMTENTLYGAWGTYYGQCGNPLFLFPDQKARYAGLELPNGGSWYVYHTDPNGVIIDVGSGLGGSFLIEGTWEAHYSGNKDDWYRPKGSFKLGIHWQTMGS